MEDIITWESLGKGSRHLLCNACSSNIVKECQGGRKDKLTHNFSHLDPQMNFNILNLNILTSQAILDLERRISWAYPFLSTYVSQKSRRSFELTGRRSSPLTRSYCKNFPCATRNLFYPLERRLQLLSQSNLESLIFQAETLLESIPYPTESEKLSGSSFISNLYSWKGDLQHQVGSADSKKDLSDSFFHLYKLLVEFSLCLSTKKMDLAHVSFAPAPFISINSQISLLLHRLEFFAPMLNESDMWMRYFSNITKLTELEHFQNISDINDFLRSNFFSSLLDIPDSLSTSLDVLKKRRELIRCKMMNT